MFNPELTPNPKALRYKAMYTNGNNLEWIDTHYVYALTDAIAQLYAVAILQELQAKGVCKNIKFLAVCKDTGV